MKENQRICQSNLPPVMSHGAKGRSPMHSRRYPDDSADVFDDSGENFVPSAICIG